MTIEKEEIKRINSNLEIIKKVIEYIYKKEIDKLYQEAIKNETKKVKAKIIEE